MRKRFLLGILTFVMFFTNVHTVFASNKPSTSAVSSDFSGKLGSFLGTEVSENDVYNWSLAISTLKTDGFSNASIAGILGNVKAEGGTKQFAIEGYSGKTTTDGKKYTEFEVGSSYDYGSTQPSLYTSKKTGRTMGGEGHGLAQWSFGRADNLTKFAEESDFDFVTVTHWHKSYDSDMQQHTCKIPNMAGQMCFMVQELNTDYVGVKNVIKDSTSASEVAKIFHDQYENSGTENISTRQAAAEEALPVVEACIGVEGSASSSSDSSQNVADFMVEEGVWGEDKFVAFCNLAETELTFPDKDSLDDKQLKGIVGWRNNIEYENDDVFIKYIRIFVMLFGILFTVWVLLIYLSYWFDRINNFLDIELLPMVTAGRLRVAPEENQCNFNPKNFVKGQVQTVNHRVILSVCLIGIFFAILIISGYMYKVLNFLVRMVLRLLN